MIQRFLISISCSLLVFVATMGQVESFWRGKPVPVHESITIKALTSLTVDLGNDTVSNFQYSAISSLAQYNNQADDDQTPTHHFDNDSFVAASARLKNLRESARNELLNEAFLIGTNSGSLRRKVLVKNAHYYIGEALHTLQDFFSHTNWLEIQGQLSPDVRMRNQARLFTALFEGQVRGAGRSQDCSLYEPEYSPLTSGWVFDPDKSLLSPKYSLANCYRPANKCPHGNFVACPQVTPPTKGLNKDTPVVGDDAERLLLHLQARGLATEATIHFVGAFLADVINTARNSQTLKDRLGDQAALEAGRVAVCSFMGDTDPLACADPIPLIIKKAGTGRGSVSSQRGLICGPDCREYPGFFTPGEVAKLNATPEPDSLFVEWSGDTTCTTSPTCEVRIDKEKTVTANFAKKWKMTVLKIDATTGLETNGGYVYSSLGVGIDCGTTCEYDFAEGTTINLWPQSRDGLVFSQWADDSHVCADSPDELCLAIEMDSNKIAKAVFVQTPKTYFTDPRDNKTYETIIIGGKEWFREDLAYMPNSSRNNYHYSQIDEVTPPGWRTPSLDDYLSLMGQLGMSTTDEAGVVWEPGSNLMQELNLKTGAAGDYDSGPWFTFYNGVGWLMTSTYSGVENYPFMYIRFDSTSADVQGGGMSDGISMKIRPVRSAQ